MTSSLRLHQDTLLFYLILILMLRLVAAQISERVHSTPDDPELRIGKVDSPISSPNSLPQ